MANGVPQQSPSVSPALTEGFRKLRERSLQRLRDEEREDQDALLRRFNSMGLARSSAFDTASQKLKQQTQKRREDFLGNIDFREAELGEQLAGEERQRQFAREETQKAREFGAAEALRQRQFASEEGRLQRGFQKDLSERDFDFREKVFRFERDSKLSQLDLAERQFQLERDAQEFNKKLAMLESEDEGGIVQGILGKKGLGGAFGQLFGGGGSSSSDLNKIFNIGSISSGGFGGSQLWSQLLGGGDKSGKNKKFLGLF